MADSTSPIQQIVIGASAPARINENFDAGSPALLYGRNAATTTGLTWGYVGGRYASASISSGTVTLTANATNYVVAAVSNGAVTVSTSATNWNDSANYIRLYLVAVNASSVVTSYQDHRTTINVPATPFAGGTLTTALNEAPIVTIASSTTPAIFAAAGNTISMTGTTTVTGFDTIAAGAVRRVVFTGILQLTHNATSMINLTGANITTAAGDIATFLSLGSGNTRMVGYERADGTALTGGSGATELKGLTFTSDTASQADSDPGAGLFRWNNATQGSSTQLFIDNATADGVSISTFWASLGAAGFLYIQQGDDSTKWQLWKWTATPTNGTGYYKFTVTLQAQSASAIANTKSCYMIFDSSGSGGSGSTQGKQSIYVAAGSIAPSSTGGCSTLTTIASASNQPDIVTLNFDATTQEYAQFSIAMPKKWNEGTVTFKAYWSHAATTTNFGVVWDLQAVAVSDDDAIAVAYGTAQTSTDTGGTTNDLYVSPESSAITVAGTPAAEDMVFFRLSRVTGNGSDTMAIDARLHGIMLYVTTDADTDA